MAVVLGICNHTRFHRKFVWARPRSGLHNATLFHWSELSHMPISNHREPGKQVYLGAQEEWKTVQYLASVYHSAQQMFAQ